MGMFFTNFIVIVLFPNQISNVGDCSEVDYSIQLILIFSNTKKTRVQVNFFQIIFNNEEVW